MRSMFVALVVISAITIALLTSRPQPTTTLTVFAAASLTDAFTEIAAAFESAHPEVTVRLSFDGSSTLATQLAEGAPADVFASANPQQMQAAQDAGRIAGQPQTFAANTLVLVVPAESAITRADDLAKADVLLILAAPGVPVREYTDALFQLWRDDADFGAAFVERVYANLASEESNVRQVVAKIALDEADAGIVYRSDITPDIAADVRVIALPGADRIPAQYPIAMTDTADADLAAAFIAFVHSPAGQAILQRWGLLPA